MAAKKKAAPAALPADLRASLEAEAAALKGHHIWLWRESQRATWDAGEARRAVYVAGGGPDTLAMKYRAYALLQRSCEIADRINNCHRRRAMTISLLMSAQD